MLDTTEREIRYVYHTADGEIHKGHSSECNICKGRKNQPTEKVKHQNNGRAGGKKGAKRLPKSKTCEKCGAKIGRQNTTGMCAKCYTGKRASTKKRRKTCSTPGCNAKIRSDNKSGMCLECYRQSAAWHAQKKQQSRWAEVMFAKPTPPTPAVEDA